MDRRGVGEDQGGAFLEAALRGQRDRHSGGNQHLFGQPAMAEHRDQPVAHRPTGNALAHRLDDAGNFSARRERTRRLELIFVLDDQNVGIIDGAGLHAHEQLAGGGNGIREVGQLQRLRTAGRGGEQGLHCAAFGKAGSLAMSAGSCWMTTLAPRFFAMRSNRSIEASVSARSWLKGGTPLFATCSVK